MRSPPPCVLVLLAAPIFFLLMPDGIPFIYAGCGNQTGTLAVYGVNRSTTCYDDTPAPIYRTSGDYIVPGVNCQFTVNLTLKIWETGCQVSWKAICGGTTCSTTLAATGPFDGSKSRTVECNGSNENMEISLGYPGGICTECSPSTCFIASGTCVH